jgi:hypothetical protein
MDLNENNTLSYKIPEPHLHKLSNSIKNNKDIASPEILDTTSLKLFLLNLINVKNETFKIKYKHGTNPLIQVFTKFLIFRYI